MCLYLYLKIDLRYKISLRDFKIFVIFFLVFYKMLLEKACITLG